LVEERLEPFTPPETGSYDRLVLGDEGYPELVLAPAVLNGHITDAEAEERYALHKLVAGEV
jgi:hypothetical protein